MKALHIFLLLLIFSSCKSDYVRALDDFQGTWQIQIISYFDGNQKVSNTGNLGVLTFGEEKVNQSDGLNRGTQTVDNWSVGFQ
jgi:hypothetical protein